MKVRSRSILRSKILADQTLRVIGVEDLERDLEKEQEKEQETENKNDLIIEDDINPC